MIPILYEADAIDFNNNGIGALIDCTSCIVEEERNGIYECSFIYPVTGQHYSEINPDRIVKTKANEKSQNQLFRIYRITKPINGFVKIYCQHISYDLNKYVVTPFESIGTSAQAIIPEILEHARYSEDHYSSKYRDNRFSVNCYVNGNTKFKLEVPTEVKRCLGGMRGSVLDLFGGEYEWDNFTIKLYESRGVDSGATILYGKNLTDINQDISISSTYTSVYPYAVDSDNNVITLDNPIIEISNAPNTATAMTLPLDLSDKFEDGETITKEKLETIANEYITSNKPQNISDSIDISFAQLWQTEEYKNMSLLERVGLCDTVTVKYSTLGVSVKAKVIAYEYNSLTEKYEKITLGNTRSNFADMFNSKIGGDDLVKQIATAKSSLQKAIDRTTKKITGQSGGYVYISNRVATSGDIIDDEEIDEDIVLPDNKPGEILVMDKPTLSEATRMWRWNIGGLGYSDDGYNGPYETAITMNGEIVADFITAGHLDASVIDVGILKDRNNLNYWNLATGDFHLSSAAAATVISNSTQTQIYNKLTNNSANEGIYLEDGRLYLNASMINTGTLSADRIRTGIIRDTSNTTSINLSNGSIDISLQNQGKLNLWSSGVTIYHKSDKTKVATSMYLSVNDVGVLTAERVLIGTRDDEKLSLASSGVTIYHSSDKTKVATSMFLSAEEKGVLTAEEVFIGTRDDEKIFIYTDSNNKGCIIADEILVNDTINLAGDLIIKGQKLGFTTIENIAGARFNALGYFQS